MLILMISMEINNSFDKTRTLMVAELMAMKQIHPRMDSVIQTGLIQASVDLSNRMPLLQDLLSRVMTEFFADLEPIVSNAVRIIVEKFIARVESQAGQFKLLEVDAFIKQTEKQVTRDLIPLVEAKINKVEEVFKNDNPTPGPQ